MQAIVILLLSATVLSAQQTERYAMPDEEVAIYNMVGQVRLEPGTGADVTVEVMRGGADGAKLKVAQSKRDGVETLLPRQPDPVRGDVVR